MPRVLLLAAHLDLPGPRLRAGRGPASGVEVVVGSEEAQALAGGDGRPGGRGAARRARRPPLDAIVALRPTGRGVDAVVAVDDRGVLVAAAAGERLGFPHNPPDAVAATRDKAAMRRALGGGRGAAAARSA